MLTAFIRYGDGTLSTDTDAASLSRAVRDPKAIFWLDMAKPTDEELGYLDEVFGFHPLAIEDSIQYSQRPKIESYRHIGEACSEGYFYMVIHGPDLATFKERLRTKELDLFVSGRFLVTIHEEVMVSVATVLDKAHQDPNLVLSGGIDTLLHQILDHLVDHYEPILEYLGETLDDLEEEAAIDPQAEILQRISQKKKELLTLRRVIGPQREVLAQLTRGDVPFIREQVRVYFRDVLDHLNRAVENIELYRDLVVSARDIYMSNVSNNLNRVMKTLTIITVLALPLNVVTGFFGMNFENIPGLHSVPAFWFTVFFMAAAVLGVLMIFRKLRWL